MHKCTYAHNTRTHAPTHAQRSPVGSTSVAPSLQSGVPTDSRQGHSPGVGGAGRVGAGGAGVAGGGGGRRAGAAGMAGGLAAGGSSGTWPDGGQADTGRLRDYKKLGSPVRFVGTGGSHSAKSPGSSLTTAHRPAPSSPAPPRPAPPRPRPPVGGGIGGELGRAGRWRSALRTVRTPRDLPLPSPSLLSSLSSFLSFLPPFPQQGCSSQGTWRQVLTCISTVFSVGDTQVKETWNPSNPASPAGSRKQTVGTPPKHPSCTQNQS